MKKFLLLIALGLTSCATHMTQEQCVSTNWQLVGMQDGVAGRPLRDLTQAAQDCQQFKIGVNRNAYVIGWNQGMKRYCSPDFNTGVTDGTMGKSAFDITERNAACMQAGLSLNTKSYEPGRKKGLKTFCTYETGAMIARQGKAMPTVCPVHSSFAKGWNSGAEQLCSQIQNAFALGKNNQPYPEACSPQNFYAFKAEYDRGAMIGAHIHEIENHIQDLDNDIHDTARHGHLERHGHRYELGADKSSEAQHSLNEVMDMLHDRRHLENDLFNLQMMR